MAAYFNFLSKILLDTFVFLIFMMAIYNVKFSQIARRLPPLLLLTLPVSLIATVTDSMFIFTLKHTSTALYSTPWSSVIRQ